MAAQAKSRDSELRSFGLVLGAAFALFFAVVPFLLSHRVRLWPFGVTAVLWIAALVAPSILSGVHAGWTRLGHALGWFNTRVILTIIFFVWVVPAALVMRLFGHDKMGSRFDCESESYRVAGVKRPSETMERPY